MTEDRFTREITALADEAAGVLDLLIAIPSDLKGVIRRATSLEPDADAVRLGVGLLSIAKKIATAEADDQPRCGSCEREFAPSCARSSSSNRTQTARRPA